MNSRYSCLKTLLPRVCSPGQNHFESTSFLIGSGLAAEADDEPYAGGHAVTPL